MFDFFCKTEGREFLIEVLEWEYIPGDSRTWDSDADYYGYFDKLDFSIIELDAENGKEINWDDLPYSIQCDIEDAVQQRCHEYDEEQAQNHYEDSEEYI